MARLATSVQRGIVYGSIWSYLQPRLAKDAQIDYGTIPFHMVRNNNFAKVRPAIEKAVRRATHGKLASDADIQDLADLLNALSNGNGTEPDYDRDLSPMITDPNAAVPLGLKTADAEPEDTVAKIKEFLRGQVPDEVLAQLDAFIADNNAGPTGEAPPPASTDRRIGRNTGRNIARRARDEDPDNRDDDDAKDADADDDAKDADDEVTPYQEEVMETDRPNARVELLKLNGSNDVKTAMDAAIKRERANQKAIREAERFVRPWVGELPAMDAAMPDDVYRAALKICGVRNADKMHADALRPVLEAQPKAGEASRVSSGRSAALASDGAMGQGFYERFPSLKSVRVQS